MHQFWIRGAVGTALFSLLVSALATDENAAVRDAIRSLVPQAGPVEVFETPVKGLREVLIGAQVVYVTDDGAHMLAGPLVDAATGRNLTDLRSAYGRRKLLDADGVTPFSWPAQNEKHRITVVTDIDCPYCRRLHKTLPEYAGLGISVDYVMLPRSGRNTPSWDKTVAAACAEDPEAAITAAMNGVKMTEASCDHPIDDHMALARELGVASTPTILLPDGQVLLGQQPASKVLERIMAAP